MPEEKDVERAIPLLIVGTDDTPVMFSNFAIVQHEQNEFIVTFGQYTPPLLPNQDQFVPIRLVARVGMTPDRMKELITILQDNLTTWEEKKRG